MTGSDGTATCRIDIAVQTEDFDVGAAITAAAAGDHGVGGVASFVGLVRDQGGGEAVSAMTLEHYPGMTEKALRTIADEAARRWPLDAVRIIHRFGRLLPGERIVLVVTASAHRDAAFDACRFLMDWLKTKAPFWKQEETPDGERWVAAKAEDDIAADRW
ncbi:molybdenum cofactor biosynthesis protein MoaE [Allostella sp. ATCC 35155]|nr:molybdenum cofactor biosynthesis protein MoaE [Stella sp. ATCC 35155]